MTKFWLMKSEPSEVSVDDFFAAPKSTVPWTGVGNYQARNFIRDAMQIDDGVLFYHSSCAVPGIVGTARGHAPVEKLALPPPMVTLRYRSCRRSFW